MLKRGLYVFGRSIRETGQAIDRIGCMIQRRQPYKEQSMFI